MKTAHIQGNSAVSVAAVPDPVPGPGEVVVETAVTALCGSELSTYRGSGKEAGNSGHEAAGTVVELGPECRHYQPGDRVVGEPHTRHCGQCYLCRTGNVQICPDKRSPGWGIHGSMAKYLVMTEQLLHRIPDSMDFDTAAVVEPTANTVHDVLERSGVVAGDFVVVLGPGPIGLLAALTARAAGAREVVRVHERDG